MRELAPQPLHDVTFRQEHLEFVKSAMADVLRPGGTAALAAKGAEYTIAGKTGTAQVVGMKQGEKYVESRVAERLRDHALFVSFAPAESPRLAVAVLVENGGHGGSAAAPIARQVFDYYLLGKKPSKPAEETAEEEDSD
jgi:penicillin-binding protein 2